MKRAAQIITAVLTSIPFMVHAAPDVATLSKAFEAFKQQYQQEQELLMRRARVLEVHMSELGSEVKQHSGSLITTDSAFDVSLILGLNSQSFIARNLELLNSAHGYDKYGFAQHVFDWGFHAKNRHASITLKALMRLRSNFGNSAAYTRSTSEAVKISISNSVTTHYHTIDKAFSWARELWLKFRFGSNEGLTVKAGFFPYRIGSGLSLGNAYVVGHTIPGHFNEEYVDQFRPGVLFHATPSQYLSFDMYGAFLNNNSDSFDVTGAFTNAQNTQKRTTPFRGSFKDNVLGAMVLRWSPHGGKQLVLSPYALFNYDADQTVEFKGDATSRLGTIGATITSKIGGFSSSFEAAFNMGKQTVHGWDRNVIVTDIAPYHTHLFYQDLNQTHGFGEPFDSITTAQDTSFTATNAVNGASFDATAFNAGSLTTVNLKNSWTRFRKQYENRYRGWMLYADLSYLAHFTHSTVQWGLVLGAASGDELPNDTPDMVFINRHNSAVSLKDVDSTYKGFVGIESMYHGTIVTPVYALEARKLERSLSATDALTKPECTNLGFIGAGFHFKHTSDSGTLSIRPNVIGYFNTKGITKGFSYALPDYYSIDYTTALQTDADTILNKKLGLECSLFFDMHFTNQLHAYFNAAVFLPGSHYPKTTGKYIPIERQLELARVDATGFDETASKFDIRLGNSVSLICNLGVDYTFDFLFNARRKIPKHKKRGTYEP